MREQCLFSHLQQRVLAMSQMIRDFGVETTLVLAARLGDRTVNLVADEMWLAGTMLLVALDLIHMAISGLSVTHCADLFHGQYELTGAYSRRLSLRVQAAEKTHREAAAETASVGEAQRR
jgi:hypothetical protein